MANRSIFAAALDRSIAHSLGLGKKFAILYLDLDRFKDVNDTLGHLAGDRLLRLMAARLQATGRLNEDVVRFGGDEFAILLSGFRDLAEIAALADQMAEVRVDNVDGKIGVTFAPSKFDPNSMPGGLARDLALDLDAIEAWGASTVVTLLEPHEFELLKIPTLGKSVLERGIDWLHLPIRDVSIPDAKFEAVRPGHSALLQARLKAGDKVVIHCRGGLGRAGMISARLLVEFGLAPAAAISRVRVARSRPIETHQQKDWVRTIGPSRSKPILKIQERERNRTRSVTTTTSVKQVAN